MRLIVFGDGEWAVDSLEELLKCGHQVAAVVLRFRPSSDSLERAARRLGIRVLQPRSAAAADFISMVGDLRPDLCVSIAYNQILRRALLDTARLGFLNLHAGKLPNYRGRNVINWAILNGEKEIGVTVHFIDERIDTGDIVLQRLLPIDWVDTYQDVLTRVVESVPSLITEAVELVSTGRVVRHPQPEIGTYFCGRQDGDEWLDWSDTSYNLHNKIRAITTPGPGARTLGGDRVVTVWSAYYDPSWPKYIATPGQVCRRTPDGVFVKTGDSTLLVKQVQIEGEASQVASWAIGTRLGVDIHALLHSRAASARLQELASQEV